VFDHSTTLVDQQHLDVHLSSGKRCEKGKPVARWWHQATALSKEMFGLPSGAIKLDQAPVRRGDMNTARNITVCRPADGNGAPQKAYAYVYVIRISASETF
jgi:hypothetical protein